jgi:hypothetical protein
MITVRVFRRGGGPVSGKEVKVHGQGLGQGSSTGRTDSTGSARFDNLNRGKYDVYIDGKRYYSGPIVDVQQIPID